MINKSHESLYNINAIIFRGITYEEKIYINNAGAAAF